jgi:hypothetical protein
MLRLFLAWRLLRMLFRCCCSPSQRWRSRPRSAVKLTRLGRSTRHSLTQRAGWSSP